VVHLTIAGPETLTFSFAPSDILLATVSPGNYTISGDTPSVPNSNFVPSSWALSPGCDYLLKVVFTSQSKLTVTAP
jgi:hypothetical protein